jgi:DNA-binding NarL/FixJ family response regulator
MLPGAEFNTVCEQVPNYESLSDDARKEIENGNYDLFLLDLRMNGISEEDNLNPKDFSGMKILRAIKKLNKGNQVIMLTASNKAWNMKALIDEGADGYYIKESPEFAFSTSYSVNNANELCKTIRKCFERDFLKRIAKSIKQYKTEQSYSSYDSRFLNNMTVQLDISYSLISQAITQQQFAFAYISLEQIFEIISDELIVEENYNYVIEDIQEICQDWIILANKEVKSEQYKGNWKNYPQWKKACSIYYQLFEGKDELFAIEIQNLIEKRNAFIHNDKFLLSKKNEQGKRIHTDIYSPKGFIRLFEAVKIFLDYLVK